MSLYGRLMADWAVTKKGDEADVVFYSVPELSFSAVVKQAFDQEIARLCPGCKVREAMVPVTTIGSTAPARVVSDLQANPDTNVAVFSTMEAATGLAAALRTAGLDVLTIGLGPTPSNLQDVKSGGLTAGLASDAAVQVWMAVDAAARVALGQELSDQERVGVPPIQLLEAGDITFDPSRGFSAYPDFAERFAKLWNVG
jgi:ribose transport system substrate-binding protein